MAGWLPKGQGNLLQRRRVQLIKNKQISEMHGSNARTASPEAVNEQWGGRHGYKPFSIVRMVKQDTDQSAARNSGRQEQQAVARQATGDRRQKLLL